MAHQVPWSKVILERFLAAACVTRTEEAVMRMRVVGYTVQETADALNISVSTVNRTIARLKQKYDQVERYDPLLPPRKFSSEELYMDTH